MFMYVWPVRDRPLTVIRKTSPSSNSSELGRHQDRDSEDTRAAAIDLWQRRVKGVDGIGNVLDVRV